MTLNRSTALLCILLTLPGIALSQKFADRAYVTNFDTDYISVIDLKSMEKIADVRTGKNPHGAAISPDGNYVAVSNEENDSVSIINPTTNAVVRIIPVGRSPKRLAVEKVNTQ